MRKFYVGVILLILAFILPACVPESVKPLSDPSNATIDKRLLGVWVGKMTDEPAVQYVHFVEAENSLTDVVLVSHQEKREAGASFYKMYPTRIGKNQYMNVKSAVPEELKPSEDVDLIGVKGYFFARYHISDTGILKIWIMMDKVVCEAVKKGQLKGTIRKVYGDDDVLITDTRENLVKFIEADHQEDLFELMFTFQRYDADIVRDGEKR